MRKQLTALIEREDDGYVSLCPELDVVSQGETIEEAKEKLREAVELFFETASPKEIQERSYNVAENNDTNRACRFILWTMISH